MTRFRAWDDGSVARLDVDERGLGLAVMDPDGQLAAVFVDGWRPMHEGYAGVRSFSRAALSDGSLGDDATYERVEPIGADTSTQVDNLGGGHTITTITSGGGPAQGGSTTVIDDDGQGKRITTIWEADGSSESTVEHREADGSDNYVTTIQRPDGTSSEIHGSVDVDGLGTKDTKEFTNGQLTSETQQSEFTQDGDTIHKEQTTYPSGQVDTDVTTKHGDGTTFHETTTTDPSGQLTEHETQYDWPEHSVSSHLNPDGSTTLTTQSLTDDVSAGTIQDTTTTEIKDASGQTVGDVTTSQTITNVSDLSSKVITTVEHPDGSSDVVTQEFDSSGMLQSQTTESNPPPVAEGPGMPGTDTAPPDGSEPGPGETGRPDTGPGETDPGETDPGETGPGETDPGETGPGETDPGETGPGETGPSGPRRLGHGGIDLSGQPCEPGSDPGCAAIVVRASERVSRGAIGPVLDALQDVHEALSPAAARRNGAFASTVERLARDAFDPDARRGSALVAEVETPADRDGAWADLRHPLVLKRSMARAAAMRDRARDAY